MIPFELHDTKFDRVQIYILSLVTSKYLVVCSPIVVRQIQQLYVQLDTWNNGHYNHTCMANEFLFLIGSRHVVKPCHSYLKLLTEIENISRFRVWNSYE